MVDQSIEKEREEAIKQIIALLNKYNLTIKIEHSLKIVPIDLQKEE